MPVGRTTVHPLSHLERVSTTTLQQLRSKQALTARSPPPGGHKCLQAAVAAVRPGQGMHSTPGDGPHHLHAHMRSTAGAASVQSASDTGTRLKAVQACTGRDFGVALERHLHYANRQHGTAHWALAPCARRTEQPPSSGGRRGTAPEYQESY